MPQATNPVNCIQRAGPGILAVVPCAPTDLIQGEHANRLFTHLLSPEVKEALPDTPYMCKSPMVPRSMNDLRS